MYKQFPKAAFSVLAISLMFVFACNSGKFSGKGVGPKPASENGDPAKVAGNPGANPTATPVSNPCVASVATPVPTSDAKPDPNATPVATSTESTPAPTPTPCVSTSTSKTGAILVPMEVYIMSLSPGSRANEGGTFEFTIVRNDGTEVCGQDSPDHSKCFWSDNFSKGSKDTLAVTIADVCECGKANTLDFRVSDGRDRKGLNEWSNVVKFSHTQPDRTDVQATATQWRNKFLNTNVNKYASRFKSGPSGSNSFYLGGWDYESGLFGTPCGAYACDKDTWTDRDDNMLYMTCQVQKCPNGDKAFSLKFVGE